MATYSKQLLSGSSQGAPILIAATSSPGTVVHTTGTSSTTIDNVTLYLSNADSTARLATIEHGSTSNVIKVTVPAQSGLMLVLPQIPLTGTGAATKTCAVFCATTNVVSASGFVDRVS